MASYEEHEEQARHNLRFLKSVNSKLLEYYDWQVTVCFYTALHFINAHLRRALQDVSFASHEKVNEYINPEGRITKTRLDEHAYVSYRALQTLSRRSRYLRSDKAPDRIAMTVEKHLAKGLYHLDVIFQYMNSSHGVSFEKITFNSPTLRSKSTVFIQAESS